MITDIYCHLLILVLILALSVVVCLLLFLDNLWHYLRGYFLTANTKVQKLRPFSLLIHTDYGLWSFTSIFFEANEARKERLKVKDVRDTQKRKFSVRYELSRNPQKTLMTEVNTIRLRGRKT